MALGVAGFLCGPARVFAQGNLDKFVVKGEAAKKALSRTEISGETAVSELRGRKNDRFFPQLGP
jgi:hypothetical protein